MSRSSIFDATSNHGNDHILHNNNLQHDHTTRVDKVIVLIHHLSKIKRLDMKVSIDITGIGNVAVRDNNGNLLPTVWTRQSINNEHENATLLTRDALQNYLKGFIEAGVAENLNMLQKVSDPALLVDWVVRTAEHWERRYAQKRDEKFDISQTVLASMFEIINEQVYPWLAYHQNMDKIDKLIQEKFRQLEDNPSNNKHYNALLQLISAENSTTSQQNIESFFWLHRGRQAIVRLLFRLQDIPNLREQICILAGKLLQKKEVCNKAGAYSSQRQRSDVVQEYNDAVMGFRQWCEDLRPNEILKKIQTVLATDEWIFYVIDHTSIPITLTHLHTPTPRLEFIEPIKCPHCQTVFNANETINAKVDQSATSKRAKHDF